MAAMIFGHAPAVGLDERARIGYSFPALAQSVTLDDLLKRVEAVEKKNADLQQENASLKAEIEGIKNNQTVVSDSLDRRTQRHLGLHCH